MMLLFFIGNNVVSGVFSDIIRKRNVRFYSFGIFGKEQMDREFQQPESSGTRSWASCSRVPQ